MASWKFSGLNGGLTNGGLEAGKVIYEKFSIARRLSKFLGFDPHVLMLLYIQCEAPKIAKLVYNSNNYGLWYL